MPRWVSARGLRDAHHRLIIKYGGLPGVKDEGGLDSALARPKNFAVYGNPDLCDLAASYAFGLATTQHFHEGNKRAALAAASIFLELNGLQLGESWGDAVRMIRGVATKEISESELADWFRQNTEPLPEE